MKIVIDIPEEVYKAHKMGDISPWIVNAIDEAVYNGIPLPKNHGRLGDLDYLYKKFKANGCKDSNVYRLIKDEPTIIKGTKESTDADSN